MRGVAQRSGQVVPQLCLCPKAGTRWLRPRAAWQSQAALHTAAQPRAPDSTKAAAASA